MNVRKVRSADGTQIVYESEGRGPALILIGGAFCDRHARASGTPLAALLADRFTVLSYDRRGRGDSEDATPYAIAREVEDLAALIDAAGGSASLFGISSGGLLGLDAAAHGLAVPKLALYEAPVLLDAERAQAFRGLTEQVAKAAAEGRRSDAVELFLTRVVQVPAPAVAGMKQAPMWAGLERLAHTLSYDLSITSRGAAQLDTARRVSAPTLVLSGSASPAWMRDAAATFAGAIPRGEHRALEGQTHDVDPKVLAGALGEFFATA